MRGNILAGRYKSRRKTEPARTKADLVTWRCKKCGGGSLRNDHGGHPPSHSAARARRGAKHHIDKTKHPEVEIIRHHKDGDKVIDTVTA